MQIRVSANARRSELKRDAEGGYILKISAPPVEGKANEAVCRWLARSLGVPQGAVSIVRGSRVPRKTIKVETLDESEIERRLAALIV